MTFQGSRLLITIAHDRRPFPCGTSCESDFSFFLFLFWAMKYIYIYNSFIGHFVGGEEFSKVGGGLYINGVRSLRFLKFGIRLLFSGRSPPKFSREIYMLVQKLSCFQR